MPKDLPRRRARHIRDTYVKSLTPEQRTDLSYAQRAIFLEHFPLAKTDILAGYWPLPDEADPRPLVEALSHQEQGLCLPVVVGQSLVFRAWHRGDTLVQNTLGVWEPKSCQDIVTPTHVLVPLLAFDKAGHRLGYGRGFYDRALGDLAHEKPGLVTIGYAFDCQYVDFLPHHEQDWPLNYVVTPERLHCFVTKG